MHSPFHDIPELARLKNGVGLVRIPMEQDVPFTQRVRALVDTAAFRRLASITQLGLASRVYPGATHTRFEHALGVFHNALRYLGQLCRDRRFCELVDRHEAEVLLAAALLHDLGHWPFCHPIEDLALDRLPSHEEFAAEFLRPDHELGEVLRTQWQVAPEEVLAVLAPHTSSPPSHRPAGADDRPSLRLLRSILSGPIDIDKMDYLDRDSLHAGVPYGRNFDRNRLIQSLVVNQAGDGLAITSKGRTAAELMVFARYVMFSEVYWHHAVRSATAMLARAFFGLYRELDVGELFRRTEADFIAALRTAADASRYAPLLEGIFGRQRTLYKRVAEYSFYQSPETYRQLARRPFALLVKGAELLAARLSAELHETIHGTEILIDAPPPHREVEFDVEIYFAKEGVYRPLAQVSPMVEALARTQFDDSVKRVRIFAHPRIARRIVDSGRFRPALESMLQEMHAHAGADPADGSRDEGVTGRWGDG